MKKIIQIFPFLFSIHSLSAQVFLKTAGFTITLTAWHKDSNQIPRILDTVFLNKNFEIKNKIYTSISIADSSFIIPNVPLGKHLLLFSAQGYCIEPITITVCSECDNHFLFYSSPKKQDDDCKNIFERVEISPGYIGGDKALRKDFQKNLTKKEKKVLEGIEKFNIHFFVTKRGIISDPTFIGSDLSEVAKDVIKKGIASMTRWKPAIVNGRIADEEVVLHKKDLLNK